MLLVLLQVLVNYLAVTITMAAAVVVHTLVVEVVQQALAV
jgi:hypothetical protein